MFRYLSFSLLILWSAALAAGAPAEAGAPSAAEPRLEQMLREVYENYAQFRLPEAEEQLRKLIPLTQSQYGDNAKEVSDLRVALGRILVLQGRFAEAEDEIQACRRVPLEASARMDVFALSAEADWIELLKDTGRLELAVPLARKLYAAAEALPPSEPVFQARFRLAVAEVLLQDRHYQEAMRPAIQALQVFQAMLPADDGIRNQAVSVVARLKQATGDLAGAQFSLRQALRELSPGAPGYAVRAAGLRYSLANVLISGSQLEEAAPELRSVIATYRSELGPGNVATLAAQRSYVEVLKKLRRNREARQTETEILSFSRKN